jgi:hypothetical protein
MREAQNGSREHWMRQAPETPLGQKRLNPFYSFYKDLRNSIIASWSGRFSFSNCRMTWLASPL